MYVYGFEDCFKGHTDGRHSRVRGLKWYECFPIIERVEEGIFCYTLLLDPVITGDEEWCNRGNSLRRIDNAFPVPGRNADIDHIVHAAKHSIVEGVLALHIECYVVVEVWLKDVVVQMNARDICAKIWLRRISCKIHIFVEFGYNPTISVG